MKSFGIFIFIIGLLLGAAFNTLAVWSDLEGMSFWGYPESNSYDPEIETDGRLHSLICPVILTSSETASVKVKVSNPKDFPINPSIQASLSQPGERDNLIRKKQSLSLEPGETVEISWQVDQDNILFNRIILVRVFLFQSNFYPPSATAHCGIMVRDLGFLKSIQLAIIVVSASLVGMVSGAAIWWWRSRSTPNKNNQRTSIFAWLIALTVLSFVANFLGWMLIAGFAILLTFLSILAILEAIILNKV